MAPGMCLALAIWWECRECQDTEKIQVAYTVVHRMRDRREFGKQLTICDVIEAPKQFSFKRAHIPLNRYTRRPSESKGDDLRAWRKSVRLADDVLAGRKSPTFRNTLHFHTYAIDPPGWAKDKTAKMLPGWRHLFY